MSFSPTSTADHTGAGLGGGPPRGALYLGEGDFPFTHQAYEDAYWAGIDQRFLREGFPVEELKATRGTNPARNLGPTLDLPNYRMVKDGEVLTVGDYTLRVIATPGHTPGQLCLWLEAAGILFTADHVLFDITPNITMWPNLPNALGRYLESLEKVRALPVKLALPGHRHTGDLEARIQALFTHHRNRVGGDPGHRPAGARPHRLPGGQPDDLGHQGRQLGGLPPEPEMVCHWGGPGPPGVPHGGGPGGSRGRAGGERPVCAPGEVSPLAEEKSERMKKDICLADVLFYGRGKAWGFVGGEHRPAGQWPKAKALAQAEFISAEHLKSTGWNPKKKDIRSDVLLFWSR